MVPPPEEPSKHEQVQERKQEPIRCEYEGVKTAPDQSYPTTTRSPPSVRGARWPCGGEPDGARERRGVLRSRVRRETSGKRLDAPLRLVYPEFHSRVLSC